VPFFFSNSISEVFSFPKVCRIAGKGQPNYLRETADFDSPADIGSFPELTMGIPMNNEPAVQ